MLLAAPKDRVPGFLSGKWKSVGKSAGISGAKDDTIIAFEIIGPDKKIIEKHDHHPVAGNFKIRIDNPGQYTRAIAFGPPELFIIILCLRPPDHSATFAPVDAKLRQFASNFVF